MCKELYSSLWNLLFVILLAEIVLSAPQGYDYYANQRRNYYLQRVAQAQLIEAQRVAAQNRYRQQGLNTAATTPKPSNANQINRADVENAKFLGAKNQESDEPEKTINKKTKQLGYGNGCGFRKNDEEKGDGRVLWDFNVYNVYPNTGCGGAVGGLADAGALGGAGLSDPYPGNYYGGYPYPGGVWADPYYGYRPFRRFFRNWLGLLVPGGALSGVNRPPPSSNSQADSASSSVPPAPNYQFLSDSEAMANLTPGQLVSGVASTINNVLQQLSYPYSSYG